MKYFIKSNRPYPNSFMHNGTRYVFAAFEERVMDFNLAEKYGDFLRLTKIEEETTEVLDLIVEPAPVIPVIVEEIKEPELIVEPDETFENSVAESNEDSQQLITEPVETKVNKKGRKGNK